MCNCDMTEYEARLQRMDHFEFMTEWFYLCELKEKTHLEKHYFKCIKRENAKRFPHIVIKGEFD